jgi:hypothetical protein
MEKPPSPAKTDIIGMLAISPTDDPNIEYRGEDQCQK